MQILISCFVIRGQTATLDRTSLRAESMFISKKHLPRRTFLKGAGVSLALPLLESMVPAGTRARPHGGRAEDPARVHLHSARRDDGQVDARR